jgi:hypothetical protein
MALRSTLLVLVAMGLGLAEGDGCSAQEPTSDRPRFNYGSAGGFGGDAAGGNETGGDATGNTGGSGGASGGASSTTTGGSTGGSGGSANVGGSAGAGEVGGASGGLGAGGNAGSVGMAGSGGMGGGSGGGGGPADAGDVPPDAGATGGQCNAACMQGTACTTSACWAVSANVFKTTATLLVTNAIDGDEKTRYSTGTDAKGTEWFQIDLCHAQTISGLNVYTGGGGGDVAETYTVQVSTDATQWTEVLRSNMPYAARATLTFTPVPARYVRVNQTAVMTHWWSIYEMGVVCGTDGG